MKDLAPLAFSEFEELVSRVSDLELSWYYWNYLLPETTGYALFLLFILPILNKNE